MTQSANRLAVLGAVKVTDLLHDSIVPVLPFFGEGNESDLLLALVEKAAERGLLSVGCCPDKHIIENSAAHYAMVGCALMEALGILRGRDDEDEEWLDYLIRVAKQRDVRLPWE